VVPPARVDAAVGGGLKTEVGIGSDGMGEAKPEGVDACRVANKSEGGVGDMGVNKLQERIRRVAITIKVNLRFIPLL